MTLGDLRVLCMINDTEYDDRGAVNGRFTSALPDKAWSNKDVDIRPRTAGRTDVAQLV